MCCHIRSASELDQRGAVTRQLPATLKPPPHVGQIVRKLREAADLTRLQLGRQINLSTSTIRNVETGCHRANLATLRKLLQHSAMATLPEKAKEAGLSLRFEPSEGDEK